MRHRLHLETSFWRRLADPENAEMRRASYRFLRTISDRHRVLVSRLVTRELEDMPETADRRRIFRRLEALRPRTITTNPEIRRIARELLTAGRWTERRIADMLHVGYADFGGADALVTWDREDLARERMRRILLLEKKGMKAFRKLTDGSSNGRSSRRAN